jgi:hypothetical protein
MAPGKREYDEIRLRETGTLLGGINQVLPCFTRLFSGLGRGYNTVIPGSRIPVYRLLFSAIQVPVLIYRFSALILKNNCL